MQVGGVDGSVVAASAARHRSEGWMCRGKGYFGAREATVIMEDGCICYGTAVVLRQARRGHGECSGYKKEGLKPSDV